MFLHNYHTHTSRCNHAGGADSSYARIAYENGFKTVGFSDHAPQIGFPEGTYSWYRMKPEETEGYFASIREIKKEYEGKLNIYCGFELEYYPAFFDATVEFLRPFAPDYFILGQHFTNNEYDGVYSANVESTEDFLLYCEQVCRGMETGKYTYLAHPDLVIAPDDREKYLLGMDNICKCAKKMGMPLEYNILGLKSGRNYPTERFFELAAENACDVIIGLDAHIPDAFAWTEWFEAAEANLTHLGITPLSEIELRNPYK